MLENLLKKISGVKSYDKLLNLSVSVVKTYSNDENSVIHFIADNENHLSIWIDYIKPDLIEISNSTNKQEQILKLRKSIIDTVELIYRNAQLLGTKWSEEEKKLSQKFYLTMMIIRKYYHN